LGATGTFSRGQLVYFKNPDNSRGGQLVNTHVGTLFLNCFIQIINANITILQKMAQYLR